MGRYIDWSHVTGRYPTVANRADSTGTGSYFLEMAEYEVDGRLAPLYTVPFSPAPLVVKDLCIDLIYYKMNILQESVEPLKTSLDERFEAILNGTLLLTNSAGSLLTTPPNGAWISNSYHSMFGPDSPANWSVDSNWIQDAVDARG